MPGEPRFADTPSLWVHQGVPAALCEAPTLHAAVSNGGRSTRASLKPSVGDRQVQMLALGGIVPAREALGPPPSPLPPRISLRHIPALHTVGPSGNPQDLPGNEEADLTAPHRYTKSFSSASYAAATSALQRCADPRRPPLNGYEGPECYT